MSEIDANALPNDVDALRALVVANQLKHNAALKTECARNDALAQHIVLLEQQLATLRRARFGR